MHPLRDLGDFAIGFQAHFLSEAVLEFPLGQIWKAKENKKKKSSSCQDAPGCVQRPFPPPSLTLTGRPSLGRAFKVVISHVSEVQRREERDPARTPC